MNPAAGDSPVPGDTDSMTRLLPPAASNKIKDDSQSMEQQDPLVASAESQSVANRTNTGVRFKVSEAVENRQRRIGKRVDSARDKFRGKAFRRNTLQEGAIVKVEKMLVRVDFTQMQLEDTYDENDSLKTETRSLEKWREFMVVARKSNNREYEDFRLQIYKTRVVPKVDNQQTKKEAYPGGEVGPQKLRTSICIRPSIRLWLYGIHTRRGTRIIIMRPRSIANSVEWYTFLRDALGWKRPTTLQVNVPDLDVDVEA